MSFEHKYLKYKQKYLELKQEVALLKTQLNHSVQKGGNGPSDSDTFNVSALSDTPTLEKAKQLGGFLISSDSESVDYKKVFKNSDTEDPLVDNLTDTPMDHHMVISVDSSDESVQHKKSDEEDEEDKEDTDDDEEENIDVDEDDDSDDDLLKITSDDDDSDDEDDEDQEGGDLETSISELEEIFSQLGGKKKGKKSKDSDSDSVFDSSSLSSLSELDGSSSDFDL
jgi:hypothetical protein